MGKERTVAPLRHAKKRNRGHESDHSNDDGDSSDSDRTGGRDRSRREKRRRRSRRRRSWSKSDDEDSLSSSDSYSYSESSSDSETQSSDESEEEARRRRRRRRRKERNRKREKEGEDIARRKEKRRKERRRKKEKDGEDKTRGKKKKKKKKREEKKKDEDLGKTGAVTNSWGKYGIIREIDMWNKRPEFTAWLAEVKQVNLETLSNWEEKNMFKEFMEDHNTATFPSKKYYNLDAYHQRKLEKDMRKHWKEPRAMERTVFDDEEQRRLEMLKERERSKDQQVEALKHMMQSGMAQAMKEQAQLREEMAYQYKVGNFEAAAAIQRRLDPDAGV